MRARIGIALAAAAIVLAGGLALAQTHQPGQHQMQHAAPGMKHDMQHGKAHTAAPEDTRVLVALPEMMAQHMLTNMRDHLLALQDITEALAAGKTEVAAKVAEQRLGMSSMPLHGAHDVAGFMPKGMQDAGVMMHRAASRFALEAQTAGATGDLKPALSALSDVMKACTGCHAGYRLR